MKLLVDIGNSRIKWACADAKALTGPAGFARPTEAPDDAFARAWQHLVPTAVILCSVAGRTAVQCVERWVEAAWGVPVIELRPSECSGSVVNGYRQPATLGADRWANLLGARATFGRAGVIVVDAGTAVTVDALRADGVHLGGAILPGLQAGRAGLRSAAPALSTAVEEAPLPADETAGAIGGGTLIGLAGAIERVAAAVGSGLEAPHRVLTGGDADRLAPWLDPGWEADSLLTLRGLQAFGEDSCAG